MTMVKKSVTLTDQQDNWIKQQIASGHYDNESEVLRELIHERQLRDQQAANRLGSIRDSLAKGEASGFTDQTATDLLQEIKNGLGRNAL